MNWITVTTYTDNSPEFRMNHTARKGAREFAAMQRTQAGVASSTVYAAADAPAPVEYPGIPFTVTETPVDAELSISGDDILAQMQEETYYEAPTVETAHTPTVSILTALDAAMGRIRELNPNVPTALAVIIASGSGKKHGHFEPGSWADTTGEHAGSGRHEILMSSESLARGAEPTLVTLIHEAAHASAHAQNIKDTSRQGRFHNRKFRDTAESMGLIVEENSSIGHVTTGLTTQAQVDYADILELLAASLTTHRKPAKAKAAAEKTTVKVGCECYDDNGKQLTVTVPIKWYNAQQLVCENCESVLTTVS